MGGAGLSSQLVLAQVDELSEEAQQVVHKYTGSQSRGQAGRYASLCAASGILPWDPPTAQDHATLLAVLLTPLALSLGPCGISVWQRSCMCSALYIHNVWNVKVTYKIISNLTGVLDTLLCMGGGCDLHYS